MASLAPLPLPKLPPGGGAIVSSANNGPLSESQSRIAALSSALATMNASTKSACRTCDGLSRRSRHLDSLTSPASETSALLATTSSNLNVTSSVLKDAREKFDTVGDCEPAVERLYWGAREACREVAIHAEKQGRGGVLPPRMKRLIEGGNNTGNPNLRRQSSIEMGAMAGNTLENTAVNNSPLTEQELYAGADAMEIVRDAFTYFSKRLEWKSTRDTMKDLERVHHVGVDAMGLLVTGHLTGAGAAVRRKVDGATTVDKNNKKSGGKKNTTAAERAEETAAKTRDRLQDALQNRDLMKSIGEYEEYLPLSTRVVRELRAIFECLGGMPTNGSGLLLSPLTPKLARALPPIEPESPLGGKVLRTEKVGSGHYTNVTMKALKTGYPHLDSYGEARKSVAYASVDGYCRQLRNQRKKLLPSTGTSAAAHLQIVDSAARDAVRCIEHTMVVVSGEKSVYRCVIAPSSAQSQLANVESEEQGDEDADQRFSKKFNGEQYQKALTASYSYVVSAAVDRLLDMTEYTFMREAGCASGAGESGDGGGPGGSLDIRSAGSAAAAGLRIVDGVRMLGPSLSKLCELSNAAGVAGGPPSGDDATIASALCISLHRSTVKNCSKTLENLARAIENDPLDGPKHRPIDARVATVSSDVVHAIRVISPFVSAYKSVSKRRALPWDQNIGGQAGEMDIFVRFLIKQLVTSLSGKAQNYKNDEVPDAQAKSHLFMMNNTFYLLELLAPTGEYQGSVDGENYRINAPWFKQKMSKTFESEKAKYLKYWEVLNRHLTDVDDRELSYQNKKDVLSLESGRLLKSRFSGFIEDFERVYSAHCNFTVIDPKLREMLQVDIRGVFLARYKSFFDKYSRINFSKKNMENYLKYPPQKLDQLIGQLFSVA